MANKLFIPFINPEKWVVLDPAEVPQYLTKHFDDYLLSEQLGDMPWLSQEKFYQKWQINDTIKTQFESNFDPINISLVKPDGTAVLTVLAQNIRSNKYEPGFYVYESEMSLAAVEPGCYFRKIEAGTPVGLTMISEPINIQEKHDNTVLIEYKNSRYHADVIWETGIELNMRLDMYISKYKPGGTKNMYEDENLNPTILKAKPYRTFEAVVGDERGNPDWIIDKLNYICSCTDVKYDDKYFTVVDENAFDISDELEGYPFRGLKIKLREGINRNSNVQLSTGQNEVRLVVVYNIERKLFGDVDGDGSNNTIPILGIE